MNDLTKIALAALISVAAKEFLTQLANWLKVWKVTRKFLQTLEGMIRSHSLFLYLDFVLALFSGWQVYLFVTSPDPVTRGAVFAIALSTGLALFWVREFFHDLRVYRAFIDEPAEENGVSHTDNAPQAPGAGSRRSLSGGNPLNTEAPPQPGDERPRATKRARRERR